MVDTYVGWRQLPKGQAPEPGLRKWGSVLSDQVLDSLGMCCEQSKILNNF